MPVSFKMLDWDSPIEMAHPLLRKGRWRPVNGMSEAVKACSDKRTSLYLVCPPASLERYIENEKTE